LTKTPIAWVVVSSFLLLLVIGLLVASPNEIVRTATTIQSTVTVTRSVTVEAAPGNPRWELYFSPGGGADDRLAYWLDRSNSSICAMIYTFTSDTISDALIRAHSRGVHVKITMDQSQLSVSGGEAQTLVDSGIAVRVDRRSGLLHNKVAIIDNTIVVTGSYNWTAAAEERNRENLLIIQDPQLASPYQSNCEATWDVSTP